MSDGDGIPDRVVEHDFPDEQGAMLLEVGHASASLYQREVTQAEKKRWRREDEERDRRRIPPGFQP